MREYVFEHATDPRRWFPSKPGVWKGAIVAMLCLALTGVLEGCGSGPRSNPVAPTISSEPKSVTVPLGSNALFTVVASGDPLLTYQWERDGVAIPSATGSTYTYANIGLGDDGHLYSVIVSNGAGSVTSDAAKLSVGARSPLEGDLRFQQVGAATTVNGYTSQFAPQNLLDRQAITFPSGTGSPLALGPGCDMGAVNFIGDCGWLVRAFNLPSNVSGYGYVISSNYYSQMAPVLFQVEGPGTVITGWDIESDFDSFALTYTQSTHPGNFDVLQKTVPIATFQNAVAQDGLLGRVVTAVSYDQGSITYLSYGWTQDKGTVYDSSVVFTTKTGAAAQAQQLAQTGYILTANGGNDYDGIILVGTKVKGDSLPRPFMAILGNTSALPLLTLGYAMVAVIYTPGMGFIATLGEK